MEKPMGDPIGYYLPLPSLNETSYWKDNGKESQLPNPRGNTKVESLNSLMRILPVSRLTSRNPRINQNYHENGEFLVNTCIPSHLEPKLMITADFQLKSES